MTLHSMASEIFNHGYAVDDYLSGMTCHRDLFLDHLVKLPELGSKADALRDATDVLVLTEDWCIDSVLNVPILFKLAAAAPDIRIRIARRSDHEAFASRFPGRGGVTRQPTMIFMDRGSSTLRYWSERCASAHAWFAGFVKSDPMPRLELDGNQPRGILLAWMTRRFEAERVRFYEGQWQEGVISEWAASRLTPRSTARAS